MYVHMHVCVGQREHRKLSAQYPGIRAYCVRNSKVSRWEVIDITRFRNAARAGKMGSGWGLSEWLAEARRDKAVLGCKVHHHFLDTRNHSGP